MREHMTIRTIMELGRKMIRNEYVKNLKRIEFMVTMACTGKCKHCSEGEHINCAGHIDIDTATRVIAQVCEAYPIDSLMTFGGEPLLYPDVVYAIHKMACAMKVSRRQLITNGFFTKSTEKIEEVVHGLKECGVNELLLSVDAFHQETIPLEPVKYFAKCAVESGMNIKLSPAWLVSREDKNPYNVKTVEILREFKAFNIPIGDGNIIFPSGNAVKYLKEYFDEAKEYACPYDDDPKDIQTIGFSPNGDVLDSNVYQKGILEILQDYRPENETER